jgi:hypothetical protein
LAGVGWALTFYRTSGYKASPGPCRHPEEPGREQKVEPAPMSSPCSISPRFRSSRRLVNRPRGPGVIKGMLRTPIAPGDVTCCPRGMVPGQLGWAGRSGPVSPPGLYHHGPEPGWLHRQGRPEGHLCCTWWVIQEAVEEAWGLGWSQAQVT